MSSPKSQDLDKARLEAARAHAQLLSDARAVQARLKPAAVACNAWDGVKDKGALLAHNTTDVVRKRPIPIGAAAVGILAIVAHRPLARLVAKMRGTDRRASSPVRRLPARSKGNRT